MGQYSVYADQFWDILERVYPGYVSAADYPVLASLLYYAVTLFIAWNLRAVSRRCLPHWLHLYVADMITTFSVCACSLENAMVRLHHGLSGFAAIMFVLALWSCFAAGDYVGNPCGSVVHYMQGILSAKQTLLRIVFQFIGGLFSFTYAKQWWNLRLTDHHGIRHDRFESVYCNSDLTVSPLTGFGIEFGATFIDVFLMLFSFTSFKILETTSKIFLSVMLVVAGVHLTGMYFNPVNATTQTFGCHGTDKLVHVVVYTAGPLAAAALAVYLQRLLQERSGTTTDDDKQFLTNDYDSQFTSNDDKHFSTKSGRHTQRSNKQNGSSKDSSQVSRNGAKNLRENGNRKSSKTNDGMTLRSRASKKH